MDTTNDASVLCTTCGRDVMKDATTKASLNGHTKEMQKTYTDGNILNSSDFRFNCPYNRRCRPMTLHISHRSDQSVLKFQVMEVYEPNSNLFNIVWEALPVWVIAAATVSIAITMRNR